MKKARTIFLCIGLLIFAVSFVVIAINTTNIAQEAYERATKENSGPFWAAANFTVSFEIIFFAIPFLLSELSLIKNGYTLLKDGQPKARKVLCIISSILALLAIFAIILANNQGFQSFLTELSFTNSSINSVRIIERILFSAWLVLIVSFILGFIRIGNVKNNRDL
ncbi:MAG: hypothetical protein UH824_06490 [Acutalibacteraceae bacterium]|nr:hypothetical protein [Acutalibacteraceae bacterium]